MRRELWIGTIFVGLTVLGLIAVPHVSEVKAQKPRVEPQWEYKVSVFSYNPGERLNDEQRATQYEKMLNENSRQGWEPVTSLLTRNNVQTVGGGVTTRDSTSFVAFRRPSRR
ncbi:MAG TPA: hypothetical protein VGZ22_06565 [Isosphaeraceae bacterium]|jgi:hypothetical protein|nr:hypothetical protein [Isosphaeraceae bacterium]